MPRFCRHGRFVERCPICRETLPGLEPARKGSRTAPGARRNPASGSTGARRPGAGGKRNLRVYSDGAPRGIDDGYRSPLVPGLRNSADARRLADEVAFAHGRLLAIESDPPGLYAEIGRQDSRERATWMCFLTAYLSPLQADEPFAGIERALELCGGEELPDWREAAQLPDLTEVPLGPRTSHDPARGNETLRAYLQWVERAGSQVKAFSGDSAWTEPRRFERLFERLTLPGLGRAGRYDLLVTAGRLGLYELRADTLHLVGAGAHHAIEDLATLAAKRLFGIGEALVLERRAQALAQALAVPIEALDLAFANWGAGERANLGVPDACADESARARAQDALEL